MTPTQYRKHRTQRGLTQAALAAILGVPREAIVRREGGTQPIIAEAALALASLPRPAPPTEVTIWKTKGWRYIAHVTRAAAPPTT